MLMEHLQKYQKKMVLSVCSYADNVYYKCTVLLLTNAMLVKENQPSETHLRRGGEY